MCWQTQLKNVVTKCIILISFKKFVTTKVIWEHLYPVSNKAEKNRTNDHLLGDPEEAHGS